MDDKLFKQEGQWPDECRNFLKIDIEAKCYVETIREGWRKS